VRVEIVRTRQLAVGTDAVARCSLAVVSLVVALVYSSTDRLTDCDGCLGNAASIYQLQQLDSTWSSSRSTADLTALSAPLPS